MTAPAPPLRPVSIHIDVVRVEGLALTPAQARQFRAALQAELQRLARHDAAPHAWASTAVPSERAPPVRLAAAAPPAQLGVELGRSLWRAIGGAR